MTFKESEIVRPPCSGMTHLFFDEKIDTDDGKEITDELKAICQTCPFKVQCLSIGLDERKGIWGGKTPKERQKLKKLLQQNLEKKP